MLNGRLKNECFLLDNGVEICEEAHLVEEGGDRIIEISYYEFKNAVLRHNLAVVNCGVEDSGCLRVVDSGRGCSFHLGNVELELSSDGTLYLDLDRVSINGKVDADLSEIKYCVELKSNEKGKIKELILRNGKCVIRNIWYSIERLELKNCEVDYSYHLAKENYIKGGKLLNQRGQGLNKRKNIGVAELVEFDGVRVCTTVGITRAKHVRMVNCNIESSEGYRINKIDLLEIEGTKINNRLTFSEIGELSIKECYMDDASKLVNVKEIGKLKVHGSEVYLSIRDTVGVVECDSSDRKNVVEATLMRGRIRTVVIVGSCKDADELLEDNGIGVISVSNMEKANKLLDRLGALESVRETRIIRVKNADDYSCR